MMQTAVTSENRNDSAPSSKRVFEPPGPGTWMFDAAHCTRPRTRYMQEVFEANFAEGFRDGFARYGSLLDTIEYRAVNGYPYLCVRPLGAPPDARGTPPRFVFFLLTRLHPLLRKRVARCEQVLREKTWRLDAKTFLEEDRPRAEARLRALGDERLESMSDGALVEHIDRLRALFDELVRDHFRRAVAGMLPVGDFVAQAVEWTGCTPGEALRALRGASPASTSTLADVDSVIEALRASPAHLAEVEASHDAAALLQNLRSADAPVGPAVDAWLRRVGDWLFAGPDISEPRAIEVPHVLVGALRARLSGERPERSDDATAALRARVPEGRRLAFDELLAEARGAYGLREGRTQIDWWGLGLCRRALLEAGARLVARGVLRRTDVVFDLPHAPLVALLRGERADDAVARAEADAEWRATSTAADAPDRLGPPPSAPPPPEWLPKAAARVARAVLTYVSLLNEEPAPKPPPARTVRGVPASRGKRVATARLIRSAADFVKVRPGDVLVAPMTTPTYNVLLPMLAGIVTDRGGQLSHPAIVSREYGIPAVVGTRNATTSIPDGARVEIDGDAGVVRVLEER